ncbi:MAG TPA: sulfatase-like hydrolase/transferase [Polyangia bacterium]
MTAPGSAGGPAAGAGPSLSTFSATTTLIAGGLGGALCGVVDGLLASVAMVGTGARGVTLPLLGFGMGALGGLALAAAFLAVRALVMMASRGRTSPRRSTMIAASLLAAPVIVVDAFALFSGGQARNIPGRAVLTYVVVAFGFVAVAASAAFLSRAFGWAQGSDRSRRGRSLLLTAGGVALVAALFVANRVIFPRLYPWFHATLGLAILIASALTAGMVIGALRPPTPSRQRGIWGVAVMALVAAVALTFGWQRIGRSQAQRFAAYQKSQLLSLALGALPIRPHGPSTATGGAARANNKGLPPLPEGPRRPDADVVIITVDALRPDHVGAYGYQRNTTPNLDALAKRSVRFERAYTQAPNTSFASTTLLTGKYYPTLARLGPPDGLDTLPLLLRRYGFKTAAFYPPAVFYIAPEKLRAYAESNFHFEYVKVEFLAAEKRLAQIQEFFATEKPGRAFLWLHLFEPHETYEKHAGHDFGDNDVDRYDSEIAYADRAIGDILAYLARERPRAIVIVTADHGEEFDEHKARYHGTTLYEEQVRVPLLIAVPGLPPQVIEGPVEVVDLAPTILALLDIPIPLRMRGNDLGPWLRNPPAPSDRLPPAFAEVNDLRMAATATEKLISDDKKGLSELYDLRADPREQRNLADARPERVVALRAEIDAWLADNAALESAPVNDPSSVALPPALERARLGDVTVAAEVIKILASAEAPHVRREAARLLATTLPPRPDTGGPLEAARATADRETAGWIDVALARLSNSAARKRLTIELGRDATDGPPSDQQIAAALALAEAGDRAAVPPLPRAAATCPDPVFCVQIITALGRLRDPRATPALIARLPTVVGRREVVQALGNIADAAAVPALSERLSEDEYTPVRAEAAVALAAIGGKAAEVSLQRAARTEREPTVKAAITKALAALRVRR